VEPNPGGYRPARIAAMLSCLGVCVISARATEVAVVRGKGDRGPFARAVESALQGAGIEFDTIKVGEVSTAVLPSYRVLVLPYFSQASPEETQTVCAYVQSGGKLIAFFRLPEELCQLLGVSLGPFLQDTPSHPFYAARFAPGELPGLPERMVQESWNIFTAYPTGNTRVIGGWVDAAGADSGHPAVFANDNGFFMNHVLTADEARAKSEFLLALIGRFVPEQWERSARKALGDFGKGERFTSVDSLRQRIRSRRAAGGLAPDAGTRAEQRVDEALALKAVAEGLCVEGKFPEVFAKARSASDTLTSAYYLLFPSRDEELRGMFVSSPNPAPDWKTVCQTLKACGFNAVFPYVGSAGIAHYHSQSVPTSPLVTEGADPLAECLAAAHDAGLKVFAWDNLFNVSDGDEGFRARMEAGRRLVPGVTGEASAYLCPTQPENQQLVVDSCLELVQGYAVDGLFLDYLRYPYRPGSRHCLCAACRRTFEAERGAPVANWPQDVIKGELADPFNAWQQQTISARLGGLRTALREARPGLVVSVAVFGWPDARKNVAQNLSAWLDAGSVDLPILMNYTDSASFFSKLAEGEAKEIGNRVPWCTALGAFSHAAQFASPVPLIDQIELTRKHGAGGFVVFKLNHTLLSEFLPALREGVTATDARLPAPRG